MAEIRLSQMTASTALAKEKAIMETNWKDMLKHFIGNAKVTQLVNLHLWKATEIGHTFTDVFNVYERKDSNLAWMKAKDEHDHLFASLRPDQIDDAVKMVRL
jgi:hypothetical protein